MSCNPSVQNLSEAPDKSPRSSGTEGYVLPLILVLALVGILLGIGRLALFRHQCTLRFDRQREIERILATRSALRWLGTQLSPPEQPTNFTYTAGSGRVIGVQIRPAESIYPNPTNLNHFSIRAGRTRLDLPGVSAEHSNDSMEADFMDGVGGQIKIMRIGSAGVDSTGHVGRVMLDMDGEGSWLDDVYGRRYWVAPDDVNRGATNGPGDMLRMAITPTGKSFSDPNTPAIWIEHEPTNNQDNVATSIWARDGTGMVTNLFSAWVVYSKGKGLQLAGSSVTLFDWADLSAGSNTNVNPVGEYNFTHGTYELPAEVMDAFRAEDGDPEELRVTLEVEACSTVAQDNSFLWIRVDPAYEYEVLLDWELPKGMGSTTDVATVIHLRPATRRAPGASFTYDSHGVQQRMQ